MVADIVDDKPMPTTVSPLLLPPSVDRLPHYIEALSLSANDDGVHDTSSERPAHALRCLFSLSESSSGASPCSNTRIDMVRSTSSSSTTTTQRQRPSLIPALLSFLRRCPRDSSEQYLSLLVLNNLSIPRANKRIIALDCGGARVLGRMLCEEPGCHLLAIVIVNLTFGDEELNRDDDPPIIGPHRLLLFLHIVLRLALLLVLFGRRR